MPIYERNIIMCRRLLVFLHIWINDSVSEAFVCACVILRFIRGTININYGNDVGGTLTELSWNDIFRATTGMKISIVMTGVFGGLEVEWGEGNVMRIVAACRHYRASGSLNNTHATRIASAHNAPAASYHHLPIDMRACCVRDVACS